MEEFSCIYCEHTSSIFHNIVHHCSEEHDNKNLKMKIIKRSEKSHQIISYSKDFQITPRSVKPSPIIADDERKAIKISKSQLTSPLKKIKKYTTEEMSTNRNEINLLEIDTTDE